MHGSPTDTSNLFTALKIAQGISVSIAPDRKTVISLHLQLYAKCIKLQGNDEIKRNFVFRMGDLHTVFVFLHAIGKYINASGIDLCFV